MTDPLHPRGDHQLSAEIDRQLLVWAPRARCWPAAGHRSSAPRPAATALAQATGQDAMTFLHA